MGNFPGERESASTPAPIRAFYSDHAWIEGAAIQQAQHVAGLPGMSALALFPDLHPGKYGPTGMAALSDRLYPQLIGNDIGCGMALFCLDLAPRKLRIDKAEDRLRSMMEHKPFDPSEELEAVGLPPDLWPLSLGDIGGGNHFCELQTIGTLFGEPAIERDKLYLLVHSGSRGLGTEVFERVQKSGSLNEGLDPDSEAGRDWLLRHDAAVGWAALNRKLIAARAAAALGAEAELVTDVPHNRVRATSTGFVHHKGAADVSAGGLAPVAGSRASASYIVSALPGVGDALGAISHGAGRKYDRATMHGRVGRTRSEREALLRNEWGGKLICDDRNLVIEEAAHAYKDAGKVVADLAGFGLVAAVAEMRPLVTYKKANTPEPETPKVEHWRKTRSREARYGR
ncbi:MAG: RNA ligase RtcB family protein [Hyphomicrobiaceae bacterium]